MVYLSWYCFRQLRCRRIRSLFKAFADMDITVVMTAYGVDLSKMTIPDNFIVRDYVPQSAILERSSAAITHAGMNSIGDLLYANVPFVSIPMGADQFFLAERAGELGATIVLDVHTMTPEALRAATEKVMTDKSYVVNSRKISDSFREAGGYEKGWKRYSAGRKQKESGHKRKPGKIRFPGFLFRS
ncbi:nucleotide disphospho-sugar-binding domain-containing protein [Chitinophaga pinensis]|uniref:nucleotide disphospho-sugar-binding domain-containing protein n=1 Tax=Chitinophaga pinensis TaxID=79329 RepID=UPI0028F6FEF4|nr:nucleotide disphospho-sugar-binding domain-containing protein [Chitinophaga pinensis]